MIDIAAAARNVIRLIDANGVTTRKAVILVGTESDRDAVLVTTAAQTGAVIHNVGLELSDALITSANPRMDVVAVMADIAPGDGLLLLDRIQILMLPLLQVDVIDTLNRVARRRPVCVSWPGRFEQGRLRYANHDHPECFDEDASRALVVDLLTNEGIEP